MGVRCPGPVSSLGLHLPVTQGTHVLEVSAALSILVLGMALPVDLEHHHHG